MDSKMYLLIFVSILLAESTGSLAFLIEGITGGCEYDNAGIAAKSFDAQQCNYLPVNSCMACNYTEKQVVICYVTPQNADSVLHEIPQDLRFLVLQVSIELKDQLILAGKPLNITQISRQTKLQYFGLQRRGNKLTELYSLEFTGDTYKPLYGLKELRLNIPLHDRDLGDMVEPLTSLEVFDISYTRGLSANNVSKTLAKLNKDAIKHLCLRSFQLIGGDGYSYYLDMNNLTGNASDWFKSLVEIDLRDNFLARIAPGISRVAPNVTKLDVSGNALLDGHNAIFILECLNHPQLQELNFGYQGYIRNPQPEDYFQSQSDLLEGSTANFIFEEILLSCVNKESKRNFSNIIHDTKAMCNILLCVMPNKWDRYICRFIQSFSEIFDPDCHFYVKFPLAKGLKVFNFEHLHWEAASSVGVMFKGTLCFSENSVETIVFSGNGKWSKPGTVEYSLNHLKKVIGLDGMKSLSLDDNNLKISLDFLMSGFKALSKLNLSSNSVQLTDDLAFCNKFVNFSDISLANNNLKTIPHKMLRNCSVLRNITLSYNRLSNKDLDTWDLNGTDNLYMIDISYNNVTKIASTFREKIQGMSLRTSNQTLHINLLGNPLSCVCDSIEFLQWITANHTNLNFISFDNYTCSGENGLEFVNQVDMHSLTRKCNSSNFRSIVIGLGSGIAVLFLFGTVSIFYSVRWRLKYHFYQLQQKVKRICCMHEGDYASPAYTYDAFVSYCADDRFWVHDVLMKTLENVYGFQLCIHYRDFQVGGNIFRTIDEHMSASRTIILVVSDLSVKSNMCHFEVEEAQKHSVNDRKQLLLIKLGDIINSAPDSTVAFLLDRHTYLEWSENSKSHKLFWAKLVGHLYDDFQGSSICCCPYGARAVGYQEI